MSLAYFIGRVVGLWFETPAAYLGGLILLAVGLHTVLEARHRKNEVQRLALDFPRGIILAGLGISMDEIAIGFPLGALRLPIVAVLGAIALQTFLVTAAESFSAGRSTKSLACRRRDSLD